MCRRLVNVTAVSRTYHGVTHASHRMPNIARKLLTKGFPFLCASLTLCYNHESKLVFQSLRLGQFLSFLPATFKFANLVVVCVLIKKFHKTTRGEELSGCKSIL
jgi:hypothetical protein